MKFVDPGQRPKIPSLCHYSLQWGNQGRGPLPLIFGPNCGRKGRKKDRPPPYLRLWMTASPPLPYLYVWIHHSSLDETNAALNN